MRDDNVENLENNFDDYFPVEEINEHLMPDDLHSIRMNFPKVNLYEKPLIGTEEIRQYKEDAHKRSVVSTLPDITEILVKMNVAFLCSKGKSRFITSD